MSDTALVRPARLNDDSPLTDRELKDLVSFLRLYHPPMHAEVRSLLAKGLQDDLPIFFRLMYEEMMRYRHGKATRYLTFEQPRKY